MKSRRKFSKEFKRLVVEELVGEVSSLGQLSRRHNISPGLIVGWKKQYASGKLDECPENNIEALKGRIEQLEQMVGRLTLANEFLKKATQHSLKKQNTHTSEIICGSSADLERDVQL